MEICVAEHARRARGEGYTGRSQIHVREYVGFRLPDILNISLDFIVMAASGEIKPRSAFHTQKEYIEQLDRLISSMVKTDQQLSRILYAYRAWACNTVDYDGMYPTHLLFSS